MVQATTTIRRPLRSDLLTLLPSVLLALLMVWTVVRSIADANWAAGLDVLIPVALPALLIGALFARLHWLPGWLAHLLSTVLGFVWTVQSLGILMEERLVTWRDQAIELIIRTVILTRILSNGGRGEDILLFVAILALLAWALGYITAWMIFRKGWTWRPVLLSAFVILTNYTYVLPKPTTLFFIFLTSALLIVVYQNVLNRQETWNASQIEYPEFLPLRFVWAAALVCGTVILITSLFPSRISSEQVAAAWKTMSLPFTLARERWEDAFSTINAPPGVTTGGSFTARTSALGGARSLGDKVLLHIRSREAGYWRTVTRDHYTDGLWQNTTGEQARDALNASTPEGARTALDPGTLLSYNDVRARNPIEQVVEMTDDRKDDLIVSNGEVLEASLPILVEHNYLVDDQNRLIPNFDDTALIVSQEPLRAGMVYTVTALVSNADVQSLRQAGSDYPDWIRERYVQIPNTITERTLATAQEIVAEANATNAYDKAIAIQNHLRTFTYNDQISAPPFGVEPIDYFLFDLREGYCDYYASAMVIMLRSLDVPARLAIGYAEGYLDPDLGAYVVRENVTHTWPEVYFPGFGWERFEPTPASYTSLPDRPTTPPAYAEDDDFAVGSGLGEGLTHPDDELDLGLEIDDSIGTGGTLPEEPLNWTTIQRRLAILGIFIGIIGLMIYALVLRWRYELHGLSSAASAYARLTWLAGWAGLPKQPQSTPYEYGGELAQALPQHRRALTRIINAYVEEQYQTGPKGRKRNFEPDLSMVRRSLLERMIRQLGSVVHRMKPN
ncbi:MAG: transglutaminase domain-containing protein [Chloroflexales bacterium]|nr:transglutaminase domain-containing protein [Chloroflexales bacterium]